jgi:hypothetical protein
MAASICPTHGVTRSNPTGFCKICGARLIVDDTVSGAQKSDTLAFLSSLWQSWGAIKWVGVAIVVVLLFGMIVWPSIGSPKGPPPPYPTAGNATPAATPQGSSAGDPTKAVAPTSAATALAAQPLSQTPTATQPATATKIEPDRVVTGTLPITLKVAGINLDQVNQATLNLPNGTAATAAFQPGATDQFTMLLSALPQGAGRELTLTLQLDGTPQAAAAVVVQDYMTSKPVGGVRAEYAYTNRVNPAGPYTRMRAEPRVASTPVGMLYNDDTVDILRDNVEGWYLLRIFKSRDPGQQGVTGWIERWLIDNVGVPPASPTPTPLPVARFSARVDINFEGSGTSGQFRSCVAGRVRAADGSPYAGAQVNVNNGPKNSFNAKTGRDGVYRMCGLGASHWDVILRQVPGVVLAQQPSGVVYLNGDTQEAIVHFFRQR